MPSCDGFSADPTGRPRRLAASARRSHFPQCARQGSNLGPTDYEAPAEWAEVRGFPV
jgi:hypothetical protein